MFWREVRAVALGGLVQNSNAVHVHDEGRGRRFPLPLRGQDTRGSDLLLPTESEGLVYASVVRSSLSPIIVLLLGLKPSSQHIC